jgi:hypothetical protein
MYLRLIDVETLWHRERGKFCFTKLKSLKIIFVFGFQQSSNFWVVIILIAEYYPFDDIKNGMGGETGRQETTWKTWA